MHGEDRQLFELDETPRMDLDQATIVLCAFENPWAKAGGLFAVVREYATYIKHTLKRDVVVLSPFHALGQNHPNGTGVESQIEDVEFGKTTHTVAVHKVTQLDVAGPGKSLDWHLIRSDEFFNADGGAGGQSPYTYSNDSSDADSSKILRDSLFFARCVPGVLRALGLTDNIVLHLQDWQTAPAAVTVKDALATGTLTNVACVLSMHNPYDHGLSLKTWSLLTDRVFPKDKIQTVFRRVIPLLDAAPATVSQGFASDLVNDELQTLYFADHLQEVFQQHGVEGIDNGPFEKPSRAFTAGETMAQKLRLRKRMLEMLANYKDSRIFGHLEGRLGESINSLPNDIPFFVMTGRLDIRQKGFDVFANAIRAYFRTGRDARFLLAADAGDTPQAYIDQLSQVASMFYGKVMVCAFRMSQAFAESQAGCTYSVWPSFYEPFGGVSEFFLKGSPAIARATGGLRQQVFDIDTTPDGTGLIYETKNCQTRADWQAILDAPIPAVRSGQEVYDDHVLQLTNTLIRATEIYQQRPNLYAKMLENLYDACQRFSWERAWSEYSELYSTAANQS
jgi:glycogen synthase